MVRPTTVQPCSCRARQTAEGDGDVAGLGPDIATATSSAWSLRHWGRDVELVMVRHLFKNGTIDRAHCTFILPGFATFR